MAIQSSTVSSVYHPKRFMFVGSPTAGKTSLATSFPNPFFFDFDDGSKRAMGLGRTFDYEVFDVMNDPTSASKATARLREFIAAKTAGTMRYRTLVLDSLTTWGQAQMDGILQTNGRKDGRPQIQDYGSLAEDMRSLFGMCVRAADYVVLTAHEDIDKDELTGAIIARPLCLGKKFVQFLPSYVDEMWFCESKAVAGKRVFTIKTLPDSRHPFLRTSIKGLGAGMEDPSFEKIAKMGGFWQEPVAQAGPAPTAVAAVKK